MNALAIVTGGSSGIGRAITLGLIASGFDVYFTYRTQEVAARAIAEQYPGQCRAFHLNASLASIQDFAQQVLNERTPKILINNIGINDDSLFINQDLTRFLQIIKINFGVTLAFCKAFIYEMMKQRDGQVINISSVAANKVKMGNSAYGVSKAAIERFSKSLALEVARFNLKVNCVSPAFVQTEMLEKFLNNRKQGEFYKNIPAGKVLKPEEVANVVVALCTGVINTTGSVITIGNGENITN